MLKWMLLGGILCACAAAGRAASNIRRKRYDNLSEILAAMRVLRLRMLNSMEPVGILLRKSDSLLFRELGNGLWEGGGLEDAWRKVRETGGAASRQLSGLKSEDAMILDVFFGNLGKSGRAEQSELFASIIERMEEALESARNSYLEGAKLFTALGTLAGIGICVLII